MIVIDIGCTWENYCSDITRTVSFGTPADPDAYKVLSDVSATPIHAARQAVNAGATCGSVDDAARGVIDAAGYGAYFLPPHGTRHRPVRS